ncbi:lactate racemase domain-containing protein [Paenibacillus sp.]|uniref:lactate racemase domain-containing protein n=1 Tax=Paenibacillus sp. TaxID=58172 RepID=UPI002D2A2916|nr:lactate racemase domain-containing protein [Paenibacillus sp.]HZG85925.1 lactate racemase domain-containing protein [Paenibacillus sp.]
MNFGKINVTIEGGFTLPLPKMVKVKQTFNVSKIENLEQHLMQQVTSVLAAKDVAGKRIAVTAGSRGIKHIDRMTRQVIDALKEAGAKPFIVPSMGSHGGANAEGQLQFLANYNITEETMGVPILSSMETVQIGVLEDGVPLYCDKLAYESDGIVVMNKIKPHADFKGEYESGLVKMMVIGLGKHAGATRLHQQGFDTFHELLPRAAKLFLEKAPVLFGLAIVENPFDEPLLIEAIEPEHILRRERELLEIAKSQVAKLLLDEIDVLIVDEIGKNISGEGMDPNVTGRPGSMLQAGFAAPAIQKIVVLDVTDISHGNGAGIGMCDISTTKCVSKIDLGVMYTNAITATILAPAKLPVMMNNDREAIVLAVKTCNRIDPAKPKIVRIKNTLEMDVIEVSETYLDSIRHRTDLTVISEPYEFPFDADGNLFE